MEPHLIFHVDLSDLRDVNLSRNQSEHLAVQMQQVMFVPQAKEVNFLSFLPQEGSLVYCDNVDPLGGGLGKRMIQTNGAYLSNLLSWV
jgi:hypothetical protein